MEAQTRNLTELFQLDVRYVIPLYQRPYVWTRKKQWQPLWEDIVTVADHVATDGPSEHSPTHFLGAIVVQQEYSPPGTPARFLVIDGQQRLTTLQLLLNAAAHCADSYEFEGEAKLLRKLLFNEELVATGNEQFKVWPTNSNRRAFEVAMDRESDPSVVEDDPDNEIQEAFAFFQAQIRDWIDDGGEPEKKFKALRVTVTNLLKLVAIMLETGDSPQVIFETLNARGTPLIALDLLKNAVFLRADSESADTDDLYENHWAPELDEEYWREDRTRGRLFNKNGDLFLSYWLIAELARPVPATELFDTFRSEILERESCPSMEELVPRLSSDAKVLRSFDDMPPGSLEQRFFERLDLLDTATMHPVALLLLRSSEVSTEQRRLAFVVIEDFLVRRMICGWMGKNYNRLAADLIGALKKDLSNAGRVAGEFFAAQEAPANRWPSDEDVTEAITRKGLYGSRRQDRLVMLLWEVEERWRAGDSKTEQGLSAPNDLTLEHIIPRKWEDHWPLDESAEDPKERREQHLHRLGNLTLTTGPLNSSLSHGPWSEPEKETDKRRGLVKHSLLRMNTRLAEENSDAFDEAAIDARGEQLAAEILAIWPGPHGFVDSVGEKAQEPAPA